MSNLFKTLLSRLSIAYRGVVGGRLKKFGLKYDDLLIEQQDVMKALGRIDKTTLVERERRIKRAFDLSAKRKELPRELQAYDPFDLYLHQKVAAAQREREEKELLNG